MRCPKFSAWFSFFTIGSIAAAGLLAGSRTASAQVQIPDLVLHNFNPFTTGASPSGALIQATDGNLYGTADGVFRMASDGTVTLLHRFPANATDGRSPLGGVIQARDGNFYGTTTAGGTTGRGTVFKMTADGTVTVLHSFASDGSEGVAPAGALVEATDGNFYGTTIPIFGSTTTSTVFKVTPTGTFTVLYSINGCGISPALIQATDGNFYGTMFAGSSPCNGPVYAQLFRMTPAGAVTVLSFFAAQSLSTSSALLQATDGNVYGTLALNNVAFKMTLAGNVTVLHTFTGAPDAMCPCSLMQARDGNLYGTSFSGGSTNNRGTLFKMTVDGAVSVLHAFGALGADGNYPNGGLVQASDGNLYGTTLGSGVLNGGVVFRLNPMPPGSMSLTADFDGDGKTDLVTYRPSTGTWYVKYSSSNYSDANAASYLWGYPGDTPLVADFDGDGKTDLVFYRPSNGTWYILYSSFNYNYANWTSYQWGLPGDTPLAGDFDGDGKTDLVVYRPNTGTWYVRFSSTNYATWTPYAWGLTDDAPIAADLDGDRKTDLVVWRPSEGRWYVRFSSSNYSFANWTSYQWGLPGDTPLATDFDGDGKSDLAVWRPADGTWYVLFSSSNYSYATWTSYQWGLFGDAPIPGDFDGDGKTDLMVWRPSVADWFVRFSGSNYSYAYWTLYPWGLSSDTPL